MVIARHLASCCARTARLMATLLLWLAAFLPQAMAQSCPLTPANLPTTAPTPRPTAWVEQQAAVRERLKAGHYQLITLGDSIMAGWSERRLSDATGLTVLNAGFGQDGTEHTLWRLKAFDFTGQSPRYVLLLIGTNDIGYATCDIVSGILAVVRESHATFPMAKVIVTSILPRGTNLMGADDKIRAVNLALAHAADPDGFAFFDVHDALTCDHKTPCPLFVPDLNLHLTSAGYDVLTSRLRAFISTLTPKND